MTILTILTVLLVFNGFCNAKCPLRPSNVMKNLRGLKSRLLRGRSYIRSLPAPDPINVSSVSAVSKASKSIQQTDVAPVQDRAKLISLAAMMFWIVFIFALSRDTKDTLVVTNCGAEAIAFIKVYGVIPAAAAFMVGYSVLASQMSSDVLFNVIVTPFLVFFALFGFVIYPLRHVLHNIPLLSSLSSSSGRFGAIAKIIQHWTFVLYYIASELWGSAGIPLLFWSCANDVVPLDQAKRLYPLISMIGNLGPIFSGFTLSFVSQLSKRVWPDNDDAAFQFSVTVLSAVTVAAGAIIVALHAHVRSLYRQEQAFLKEKKDLPRERLNAPQPVVERRSEKMTLKQSLSFLAHHKHLRHIATMVLAYGVSIECTEILWKAIVHKALPVKTDYLAFMGRYGQLVGFTAFAMMFVGSNTLNRFGWGPAAVLTPLSMVAFSIPFYISVLKSSLQSTATARLTKPLLTAVYTGLVLHVITKASKYSIFDPVKEMAYIPLDPQSKTQGKAAIDVLGARLGKSAGALLQQLVVVGAGGVVEGAPFMAVVFFAVLGLWVNAVRELAPSFDKADNGKEVESDRQTTNLSLKTATK